MPKLDKTSLQRAFSMLGEDLAARGLLIEIAVFDGRASVLRFEWRRSTKDVEVVVREEGSTAALRPSVEKVAAEMGLDHDWLDDSVGMSAPLPGRYDLFEAAGTYPTTGRAGLRVVLATAYYLLAMRLHAPRNLARGDKDLVDARHLAEHLGIDDERDVAALFPAVHGEPAAKVAFRLPSGIGGVAS